MSFMEKKDWKPCPERSNSGATSQGVATLLGKNKKSCPEEGIFFLSPLYIFLLVVIRLEFTLLSLPLLNKQHYLIYKKMKTTLTSSEKKYLKHFAKSYILLPTKYKKPLVKN